MIQEAAFDPESGAPLSREKHWTPWHRVGVRTPVEDPQAEWHAGREGALTNGELQSSQQGLLGYFRRVHRDARDPNPELDRTAALALKRLKSVDATDHAAAGALDAIVWLALAERLAAKGHWVAWMLDHFVPRCPHCASALKFRRGVWALEAVCASSPNRHGTVDDAIHDAVATLYRAAFDDAAADDVLTLTFC